MRRDILGPASLPRALWLLLVLVGLLLLPVQVAAQGDSEDEAQARAEDAEPGESGSGAEASGGEAGAGDGEQAASGDGAANPLFELDIKVQRIERKPIAVVEPTNVGETADASSVDQTIVEVIRRDLEISGLFEVVSASTYGALVDLKRDGVTTSTIDFDGWYIVGAALLVKGTFARKGDEIEIDLRLFSVDEGRQIDLNWSKTTTRPGGVRKVAHEFVNAIIEYYTGEPGIFGTRILFAGPDSGNQRRLYSIDNAGFALGSYDVPAGVNVLPAWGPAGTILFTRLSDEGDNVYQFRNRDDELTQVTDVDSGYASGADYCRSDDVMALTLNTDEGTDIYTMKMDGTELTQLTHTPEIIETSPSWGPGCTRMAYVSDESGRPQIYVMNRDGSESRRLTWVGNYNTTPDWSPKGDKIAFTARDERRRFDIFTIEVASGHITRLTQDQGNNEEPTFSPDGRYLAFQSTRDGRQPRLYVMTADGRWQTRISDMPGVRTPDWHN